MKAQAGIEFIVLFSILVLILLGFAMITLNLTVVSKTEKEIEFARSLCKSISTELQIANKIGDGYWRSLELPRTIMGKTYNVSVTNYFVDISWDGKYISCPTSVDSINGSFAAGKNFIQNNGGIIYVEQ